MHGGTLFEVGHHTREDSKQQFRTVDGAAHGQQGMSLSGGQRQRVALAAALVGRPELVFLDEPTAGLDPQARRATWELMEQLRADGVSIILTTHLMDEVERLADHVVIVDQGRLVAEGSPSALTSEGAEGIVQFEAQPGLDVASLAAALPGPAKVTEVSSKKPSIHSGWSIRNGTNTRAVARMMTPSMIDLLAAAPT